MSETRLPHLGDIIVSKQFVYGHLHYIKKDVILVGEDQPNQRVMIDGQDFNRYDTTRGSAFFLVINARYDGGETGMGFNDQYPDAWQIEALRLNNDRTYNTKGEMIRFYVESACLSSIPVKDISVVGTFSPKGPLF